MTSGLFSCRLKGATEMDTENKEIKRCYFWKVYRYSVPVEQITLKGWITWCNELYEIQHGKKREGKIFVDSEMKYAVVKGRIWNKDRIEQWLTEHGYSWTCKVDTKYQFNTTGMENVVYINVDDEIERRQKGA